MECWRCEEINEAGDRSAVGVAFGLDRDPVDAREMAAEAGDGEADDYVETLAVTIAQQRTASPGVEGFRGELD